MTRSHRRAKGGQIDRSRPISFFFDGRRIDAFAGDTVASALLADGQRVVGRSFKYHRPRGLLGGGAEEPNALLGVDRGPGRFEPNQRATSIVVTPGLRVVSQNRWPSLAWDAGRLNDLLSPILPAGFYYKTFMWPRWAWRRLYEPRIRQMAGLGQAPRQPDADHYTQTWAHCDLLIVGAGPGGLSAALAAAPSGRRILICDEGEQFGGDLLAEPDREVQGQDALSWIEATLRRLEGFANVRLLPRTTAISYGTHNLVTLVERLTDHLPPADAQGARQRLWLVRAARVVLATGAIERPLVFPNNDRPGVMLASAVRRYLGAYGVFAGHRAVVCANHDSGYEAAFAFARAGGQVAAIVDLRPAPATSLAQQAGDLGIPVLAGFAPADVRGATQVRALGVGRTGQKGLLKPERWIDADLVMMAGGWTPSVHLHSQSGGKLLWHEELQAYVPGQASEPQQSVGACAGSLSLEEALAEGAAAGAGAASSSPRASDLSARVGAAAASPTPSYPEGRRYKAFVDFQNDVTAKDIRLAIREGFHSVEHIKRYTTNGMATDQGRTSNLNAIAIASHQLQRPAPQIGLTTFRAPYTPTSFGALAGLSRGSLFEPVRRTPTHDWASSHGAVFEAVGHWQRAHYFARAGEGLRQAVARECRATRSSVGMFDASTLGKIEVVGPDALAFLNLMYVNDFSKLPVGRCRYAVMLGEDGFILDDGVVARLAADRFHVTTTTGGAAGVLHQMEDFRQTEFPHLKVWLTSITEQWATIGVNGPKARAVLRAISDDIDVDPGEFPHMAIRTGHIAGLPARVFSASFTGELGYEINVPSGEGQTLWDAVLEAGHPFHITPYGTESMHVLRAEKGYIIVGQETDGTVTPGDVGLSRMIGARKTDFVGKRSLSRPAMSDPMRHQLVGLLSQDGRTVLPEGAQVVAGGASFGHISSSYWSEAVGRPIALALVSAGRSRMGQVLTVSGGEGDCEAEVVSPVFFDPEGARLNV